MFPCCPNVKTETCEKISLSPKCFSFCLKNSADETTIAKYLIFSKWTTIKESVLLIWFWFFSNSYRKQESPPAWTQEAYRQRRINYYSVGYPPPARSDGGYPRWGTPLPGYPPARSDGGYPRWGTPHQGTPQPGPMGGTQGGVPPCRIWLGYPPPGPGWGTSLPHLDLARAPPNLDLARVPPLPGPGLGTPPLGVDRQKDRHVSKHNLPVVLRTRSVRMQSDIELVGHFWHERVITDRLCCTYVLSTYSSICVLSLTRSFYGQFFPSSCFQVYRSGCPVLTPMFFWSGFRS